MQDLTQGAPLLDVTVLVSLLLALVLAMLMVNRPVSTESADLLVFDEIAVLVPKEVAVLVLLELVLVIAIDVLALHALHGTHSAQRGSSTDLAGRPQYLARLLRHLI